MVWLYPREDGSNFGKAQFGANGVRARAAQRVVSRYVRRNSDDKRRVGTRFDFTNERVAFAVVQVIVHQNRIKGFGLQRGAGFCKAWGDANGMAAKKLFDDDLGERCVVFDEQDVQITSKPSRSGSAGYGACGSA